MIFCCPKVAIVLLRKISNNNMYFIDVLYVLRVALKLPLTFWGLAKWGIRSTNVQISTNVDRSTNAQFSANAPI